MQRERERAAGAAQDIGRGRKECVSFHGNKNAESDGRGGGCGAGKIVLLYRYGGRGGRGGGCGGGGGGVGGVNPGGVIKKLCGEAIDAPPSSLQSVTDGGAESRRKNLTLSIV